MLCSIINSLRSSLMTLSSEYHWHYLTAQLKFTNFWPKWTKFWFWTGASAGSELVQHANLLLNWLDFTSWSRPFSRCIRLQFPSTARNNYGWRHRLKHCRFSSRKYFVYFSRRRVTARCSSSGSKWHHLIPEEAPAPNQHQKHFGWNGVIMTFDWHMHKIILLLK